MLSYFHNLKKQNKKHCASTTEVNGFIPRQGSSACCMQGQKKKQNKTQSISLKSGTGKLDWLNGWAGKPNKLSEEHVKQGEIGTVKVGKKCDPKGILMTK